MVPEAIFFAMVTCAPTKIVNNIEISNKLEVAEDYQKFNFMSKRCGHWYPKSPCIKKFIIKLDPWGQRSYQAVCYKKSDVKKPVMPIL